VFLDQIELVFGQGGRREFEVIPAMITSDPTRFRADQIAAILAFETAAFLRRCGFQDNGSDMADGRRVAAQFSFEKFAPVFGDPCLIFDLG
jgi:hypothetical protein